MKNKKKIRSVACFFLEILTIEVFVVTSSPAKSKLAYINLYKTHRSMYLLFLFRTATLLKNWHLELFWDGEFNGGVQISKNSKLSSQHDVVLPQPQKGVKYGSY